MSQFIQEISDEQFEQATAQGVTLVDFWAPWCGPCRMQGPILEEVAQEVGGRAAVAKVNVDQYPQSASRLGVQGIPTLVLFKDGVAVSKFVGLQQKETLVSALRSALATA